jgi:transcriptional regulator with XRE-family HTH domain
MNAPINGKTVRILRDRKGLSQGQLAEEAKLSTDSLSRLERGKQSGSSRRTQDSLAAALGVEAGVLTGDLPLPPQHEKPDDWLDTRRYQLNYRVDGATQNAYTLVSARYGIPKARIVELAPLLFVLVAEKSLADRKNKIERLNEAIDAAAKIARDFHHLPNNVSPEFSTDQEIKAEEKSIAAADIFGRNIPRDLFILSDYLKPDYDPDKDNPFVCTLQEMATDRGMVKVEVVSEEGVSYEVCRKMAHQFAGQEIELTKLILNGWALLADMPESLRRDGPEEGRMAWLRQKKTEYDAYQDAFLNELI